MIQDNARVGVVVPMFNAERTIRATLTSICQQNHQALDIIVVDDGSTDQSASIVASCAERDPRIRLMRQSNAGVTQARNSGAASTDAEFLAFVDAEDLWAPSKIALQLRTLQEGGSSAGLAYCWLAQIDEDGRVFALYRPDANGRVLQRMCRMNFVGNGSSMLMRRRIRAGGTIRSFPEGQECTRLRGPSHVPQDSGKLRIPCRASAPGGLSDGERQHVERCHSDASLM
ncbi:glycosyltransferase family 2 protein [Mesorhizobium sp.]|uniref:glycosyltransferase family 2 protein n=1 Tax=Mesorhizobium sp. TaxID=1871066 RepID=UPI00257B26E9|nr:glycosyltransferase family A protein [Mesorhizobium sp.]